jgi:predicted DsbA family dithiol-disulfide isomerase
MSELSIDVWSDIACPWCYVGKRRLEAALQRFSGRHTPKVTWHAFELNPSAPRQSEPGNHAERLAKKYGMSLAQAEQRTAHLKQLAQADGLNLDFERMRPANTFDAHRLVRLGLEHGRQTEVKERLLNAYFSEGAALGERDTLVRLGAEAGLDTDVVSAALASDTYVREVRADEKDARDLGIQGVPFFVFAKRYAVSGAQPVDLLLSALQQADTDLQENPDAFAEGAVCGPDGC